MELTYIEKKKVDPNDNGGIFNVGDIYEYREGLMQLICIENEMITFLVADMKKEGENDCRLKSVKLRCTIQFLVDDIKSNKEIKLVKKFDQMMKELQR